MAALDSHSAVEAQDAHPKLLVVHRGRVIHRYGAVVLDLAEAQGR